MTHAAVPKSQMEQTLHLKLKENISASLYFTGTEFLSVLSAAKMLKLLYGYISESCQSIYSVSTNHHSDNMCRKRGLLRHMINDSIFRALATGFLTEFSNIPHVNLIDSQSG